MDQSVGGGLWGRSPRLGLRLGLLGVVGHARKAYHLVLRLGQRGGLLHACVGGHVGSLHEHVRGPQGLLLLRHEAMLRHCRHQHHHGLLELG